MGAPMGTPMLSDQPVRVVIQQHVDEGAVLADIREGLVTSPHVDLEHLELFDERIAAHLDAMAVAGEAGAAMCTAALASPGRGEMFVAVIRAIEDRNTHRLDKLLALAEAVPDAQAGAAAALGWASPEALRGLIAGMFRSPSTLKRRLAIGACASHGLDPGPALTLALQDPDPQLRARALRAAGDCGRLALRSACIRSLSDEDADCRSSACRSAVRLGDRGAALESLRAEVLSPEGPDDAALGLLLKVLASAQAAGILKVLFEEKARIRSVIQGMGVSGDARFLPWLIGRMADPRLSRLAGESFSMITGLDLAAQDLERQTPDDIEAQPTQSAQDSDVAMDEDDGLPWPDPEKVQAWWSANMERFQPGVRYFLGAPPAREHCLRVLKDGYQRQRMAAAEYLCLSQPGTVLFNCEAPAWRQQRWLAQMH